jgi:hypothetical protein
VSERKGVARKAIRKSMKTKGKKYRDGGHEEDATRVEGLMAGWR